MGNVSSKVAEASCIIVVTSRTLEQDGDSPLVGVEAASKLLDVECFELIRYI